MPKENRSLAIISTEKKCSINWLYQQFLNGQLKLRIPKFIQLNHDFVATLHCLKNTNLLTIDSANIPSMLNDGVLKQTKGLIRGLTHHDLNLDRDGFEVHYLPNNIVELLDLYREHQDNVEEAASLRKQLRQAIERTLSQYFPGYEAIAVDSVYRNTTPTQGNAFKSVPLVHIDFDETDLRHLFQVFKGPWGSKVKAKGYDYSPKDLAFMVNVWMPLDTVVSDPLVLQSSSRKKVSSTPYNGVRRDGTTFTAKSLTEEETLSNKWHYYPYMPKGACYLFSSMKTPHSATTLEDQRSNRQSLEFRLMFFKQKNPPSQSSASLPNRSLSL